MRLGKNLLAGLANSGWRALVYLAVVPFYIKFLGIEAYGLIGFFATTQALLQILDLGLAPTINREVARGSASGDLRESRNLLHSLAVIYWGIAIVIGVLIAGGAPLIAHSWLQPKELSQEAIVYAVSLMGVTIAARWPSGLYLGALMGAQRLTVASSINIVFVTLGSVGALGVLALISPTIQAFFVWQALVGILYALTMRRAAWWVLQRPEKVQFDSAGLKRIWRFSAGVSGVALSGIILAQIDKILLSRLLSLNEFGHYMLASVVVSGLYIVTTPLFNTMYPRFSFLMSKGETLMSKGERDKLIELYRLGTRLLLTAILPLVLVLVVFGESIVRLWTGDSEIAQSIHLPLQLMAVGAVFHSVMFLPYALQLASGNTRLPLTINCILIAFLIPLIFVLAPLYGASGGASARLGLYFFYFAIGSWLTHRVLLKEIGVEWIFRDVGIPLSAVAVAGALAWFLVPQAKYSDITMVKFAAIFAVFAALTILALSPRLCRALMQYLGRRNTRKNTSTKAGLHD